MPEIVEFPSYPNPLWQDGTITTSQDGANMRSNAYVTQRTEPTNVVGVLLATHSYSVSRYDNLYTANGRDWHAYRIVYGDVIRNVFIADSVIASWKVDTSPIPLPAPPKPELWEVHVQAFTATGTKENLQIVQKIIREFMQSVDDDFANMRKVE